MRMLKSEMGGWHGVVFVAMLVDFVILDMLTPTRACHPMPS